MAAILLASNDWLSADNTEGWLRRVLFSIFGPVPVAKLAKLHFLARKAGHLLSYAVLAWLSYRSARASLQDAARPSGGWHTRAALYGLGFTLTTASLDELHQAFTHSRTGAVADVLLDMSGAVLAFALIWIASLQKRKALELRQD